MRRAQHLSAVIALFAVILASQGCGIQGGDSSTNTGEPPLSAVSEHVDTRAIALPLDAFRPSQDQLHQISQARAVLSTKCLRRYGYDIQPPEIPKPSRARHEGRYGLVDLSRAERFGYHDDPVRAQRPKEPELAPEAFNIMHGSTRSEAGLAVPEGGCLGEAARELKSPDSDRLSWMDNLDDEAKNRSESDSRVLAAFEKWSGCMRESGFNYTNPWQAVEDPKWKQAATTSEAEVAVAVADVRCKETVNLVPLWYAVDTAYQRLAVEKHQEVLGELKVQVEQQIRRSAEVLRAAR